VAPGGAAARGERWWPVALAIVVAVVLHVPLPANYRVNPPWAAPAVLLALLAALIIGDPGRIDRQETWLRIVTQHHDRLYHGGEPVRRRPPRPRHRH
jgi:hypothetical protein